MGLEEVLSKFTYDDEVTLGFVAQTEQIITNLYANGGAEIRIMLDQVASADNQTYLIQQITDAEAATMGVSSSC